jgi:hypothetical protein
MAIPNDDANVLSVPCFSPPGKIDESAIAICARSVAKAIDGPEVRRPQASMKGNVVDEAVVARLSRRCIPVHECAEPRIRETESRLIGDLDWTPQALSGDRYLFERPLRIDR